MNDFNKGKLAAYQDIIQEMKKPYDVPLDYKIAMRINELISQDIEKSDSEHCSALNKNVAESKEVK
ncbi:MAG: hypothetical protein KC550_02740 [Nanoarchaeota archaeon]|nr:hypothetical protein [Nanoarchaeota archaeon]